MRSKKRLYYLFLTIGVALFILAWFTESEWLHIFGGIVSSVAISIVLKTPKRGTAVSSGGQGDDSAASKDIDGSINKTGDGSMS